MLVKTDSHGGSVESLIQSIGREPIHLTAFDKTNKPEEICGHSVMMGFLDNEMNEKVFTGRALKIAV